MINHNQVLCIWNSITIQYILIMMQTLSSSIPHNWIVKAKLEQVLLAMDFRDRTGPF